MFTFALLGLAGAILPSGGQPIGEAAYWVRAEDFPATEWHKAAITRYDLMVDKAGLPVGCTVTGPSGSATIDKVACASLVARAKYSPARDAEGRVVPQAIRGKLEWHPDFGGGGNTRSVTPDLSVTTPLVIGRQGNLAVKVVLIYDRSGGIEQCIVIKGSQFPQIDGEACTAATGPGRFSPVRDQSGATTRGVREIEVVFSYGEKQRITVLWCHQAPPPFAAFDVRNASKSGH